MTSTPIVYIVDGKMRRPGNEITIRYPCMLRVRKGQSLTLRKFDFIHSFIEEFIRRSLIQEIFILRGDPAARPWRYRSVLSNMQNALSLFLGRRRISKGSQFQARGTVHTIRMRAAVYSRSFSTRHHGPWQ